MKTETREEWLRVRKMKAIIREENFIKYNKTTKRTVTVDYNWLGYVYDEYEGDNNLATIQEWRQVMEDMLWSEVTLKGIHEPKTLTINYVCYGENGYYTIPYQKVKIKKNLTK